MPTKRRQQADHLHGEENVHPSNSRERQPVTAEVSSAPRSAANDGLRRAFIHQGVHHTMTSARSRGWSSAHLNPAARFFLRSSRACNTSAPPSERRPACCKHWCMSTATHKHEGRAGSRPREPADERYVSGPAPRPNTTGSRPTNPRVLNQRVTSTRTFSLASLWRYWISVTVSDASR